MDRGKDTKSLDSLPNEKVERSIRQRATHFVKNPDRFKEWVQKSAMTQCLTFEYLARNEKDATKAKAAAEAFARLAEKLIGKG